MRRNKRVMEILIVITARQSSGFPYLSLRRKFLFSLIFFAFGLGKFVHTRQSLGEFRVPLFQSSSLLIKMISETLVFFVFDHPLFRMVLSIFLGFSCPFSEKETSIFSLGFSGSESVYQVPRMAHLGKWWRSLVPPTLTISKPGGRDPAMYWSGSYLLTWRATMQVICEIQLSSIIF